MRKTHRDFCPISQRIVKLNAEGEVNVFGTEGAGLFNGELVPGLSDGDL